MQWLAGCGATLMRSPRHLRGVSSFRRVRPLPCACAQGRSAASLPDVAGVILTNEEIPADALVRRIRRWAERLDVRPSTVASSSDRGQRRRSFDLLQLSEEADGKLAPRALCGLLRARLALPGSPEPLRAMVMVFYRSRDFLNTEFWEDQSRQLCDIIAEEYLGSRGVMLAVHHRVPTFPLALELGDHRLLGQLEALHSLGPSAQDRVADDLMLKRLEDDAVGSDDFLRVLPDAPVSAGSLDATRGVGAASSGMPLALSPGRYVLADPTGEVACGLSVLSVQPWRLVCSGAWARHGRERALAALAETLRQRAAKPVLSVLGDARDPQWRRLGAAESCSGALGWYRMRRPMGIAVTASPVGLQPSEQVALATIPLLVPWAFLPFHTGSLVVI